ncbi:MAG TPA: hypothetical protein VJ183_01150 [Chloroflexia bacterium]|nr:hypothetical protein [Chloroflexia bacterium]
MTDLAANDYEGSASTLEQGQTQHVQVRSGLAGMVQADEVSIMSGGAMVAVAAQDFKIMSGGGSLIVAGHDMSITSGGGSLLVAGNSMNIQNGGGAAMITPHASLNRSFVAFLLCGKADVSEGSRILLGTPQAAVFGAALGLAITIAGRLLRHK